ncbi:MAG TPA: HigA family addiction module antitoxin [Candidatus Polarisedimenticolia bacterium]|jgi:HTH-type transcriptional regulator/antitoxin HigA|nr:HigA family addiction module antitoxin [Candidatus Polarisedimenticolia bacterium]
MHPGRRLKQLLEEKGWSQDELAQITGKNRQTVSNIVSGRTGVSPEMAIALGAAFGNDPADWLRWTAEYELSVSEADGAIVEKRARLFSLAPIREMQKRGWIRSSDKDADLESDLTSFFGASPYSDISFPVAARRTAMLDDLNPAERAWCFRARQISEPILVNEFKRDRLPAAEKRLRQAAAFPKEANKVSTILSDFGIRFVVVEPLSGAKIDGASFFLDDTNPVIAVSLRYDRIDAFWHTLFHEFAHIKHGDSYSVDTTFQQNNEGGITILLADDQQEKRANESASDALIPRDEIESFIRRLAPFYSSDRIVQFAHRMKIHPGIIVGQLQYRGEIGYGALRTFLVKIRSIVIETALTDGWGLTISPTLF